MRRHGELILCGGATEDRCLDEAEAEAEEEEEERRRRGAAAKATDERGRDVERSRRRYRAGASESQPGVNGKVGAGAAGKRVWQVVVCLVAVAVGSDDAPRTLSLSLALTLSVRLAGWRELCFLGRQRGSGWRMWAASGSGFVAQRTRASTQSRLDSRGG